MGIGQRLIKGSTCVATLPGNGLSLGVNDVTVFSTPPPSVPLLRGTGVCLAAMRGTYKR